MPRRSDDPGKGKKKKMKGILRAATRFLRGKKKGKSAEAQQAPAEPPPPIEQEGSPRLLYARDVYAFGADLTTWTPLFVMVRDDILRVCAAPQSQVNLQAETQEVMAQIQLESMQVEELPIVEEGAVPTSCDRVLQLASEDGEQQVWLAPADRNDLTQFFRALGGARILSEEEELALYADPGDPSVLDAADAGALPGVEVLAAGAAAGAAAEAGHDSAQPDGSRAQSAPEDHAPPGDHGGAAHHTPEEGTPGGAADAYAGEEVATSPTDAAPDAEVGDETVGIEASEEDAPPVTVLGAVEENGAPQSDEGAHGGSAGGEFGLLAAEEGPSKDESSCSTDQAAGAAVELLFGRLLQAFTRADSLEQLERAMADILSFVREETATPAMRQAAITLLQRRQEEDMGVEGGAALWSASVVRIYNATMQVLAEKPAEDTGSLSAGQVSQGGPAIEGEPHLTVAGPEAAEAPPPETGATAGVEAPYLAPSTPKALVEGPEQPAVRDSPTETESATAPTSGQAEEASHSLWQPEASPGPPTGAPVDDASSGTSWVARAEVEQLPSSQDQVPAPTLAAAYPTGQGASAQAPTGEKDAAHQLAHGGTEPGTRRGGQASSLVPLPQGGISINTQGCTGGTGDVHTAGDAPETVAATNADQLPHSTDAPGVGPRSHQASEEESGSAPAPDLLPTHREDSGQPDFWTTAVAMAAGVPTAHDASSATAAGAGGEPLADSEQGASTPPSSGGLGLWEAAAALATHEAPASAEPVPSPAVPSAPADVELSASAALDGEETNTPTTASTHLTHDEAALTSQAAESASDATAVVASPALSTSAAAVAPATATPPSGPTSESPSKGVAPLSEAQELTTSTALSSSTHPAEEQAPVHPTADDWPPLGQEHAITSLALPPAPLTPTLESAPHPEPEHAPGPVSPPPSLPRPGPASALLPAPVSAHVATLPLPAALAQGSSPPDTQDAIPALSASAPAPPTVAAHLPAPEPAPTPASVPVSAPVSAPAPAPVPASVPGGAPSFKPSAGPTTSSPEVAQTQRDNTASAPSHPEPAVATPSPAPAQDQGVEETDIGRAVPPFSSNSYTLQQSEGSSTAKALETQAARDGFRPTSVSLPRTAGAHANLDPLPTPKKRLLSPPRSPTSELADQCPEASECASGSYDPGAYTGGEDLQRGNGARSLATNGNRSGQGVDEGPAKTIHAQASTRDSLPPGTAPSVRLRGLAPGSAAAAGRAAPQTQLSPSPRRNSSLAETKKRAYRRLRLRLRGVSEPIELTVGAETNASIRARALQREHNLSDKVKSQLQRVIDATAGELREAEAKAVGHAEAQGWWRASPEPQANGHARQESRTPGAATGLGAREASTAVSLSTTPQEQPSGDGQGNDGERGCVRERQASMLGAAAAAPAPPGSFSNPASACTTSPVHARADSGEARPVDSVVSAQPPRGNSTPSLPASQAASPAHGYTGVEDHNALVQGLVREFQDENVRLRSQLGRKTDELEAEVATKEKQLLALNKRLEDLQEEHSALRAELVTVRIQRDAEREVLHQFAVSLHDRYGLGGELVTELRRETEKEAGSGEGAGDGSAGRGVPLAQVIAAVEKVIARERARGDDLEQGLTAARRRVRELEELDEVRKSQMEHQARAYLERRKDVESRTGDHLQDWKADCASQPAPEQGGRGEDVTALAQRQAQGTSRADRFTSIGSRRSLSPQGRDSAPYSVAWADRTSNSWDGTKAPAATPLVTQHANTSVQSPAAMPAEAATLATRGVDASRTRLQMSPRARYYHQRSSVGVAPPTSAVRAQGREALARRAVAAHVRTEGSRGSASPASPASRRLGRPAEGGGGHVQRTVGRGQRSRGSPTTSASPGSVGSHLIPSPQHQQLPRPTRSPPRPSQARGRSPAQRRETGTPLGSPLSDSQGEQHRWVLKSDDDTAGGPTRRAIGARNGTGGGNDANDTRGEPGSSPERDSPAQSKPRVKAKRRGKARSKKQGSPESASPEDGPRRATYPARRAPGEVRTRDGPGSGERQKRRAAAVASPKGFEGVLLDSSPKLENRVREDRSRHVLSSPRYAGWTQSPESAGGLRSPARNGSLPPKRRSPVGERVGRGPGVKSEARSDQDAHKPTPHRLDLKAVDAELKHMGFLKAGRQ